MKGDIKENTIIVLKDFLKETKRVRFEGNNYSKEWHEEAEKRGLPNTKNTPTALELFLHNDTVELFSKYNTLSKEELESKIEIKLEAYINIKDIEFKTAINIANTMILPALTEHITKTANAANSVVASGVSSTLLVKEVKMLDALFTDIKAFIADLQKSLKECEAEDDLHKQAHAYAEKGANSLAKLRAAVDSAEKVVAGNLWPMAKYQELLNIL